MQISLFHRMSDVGEDLWQRKSLQWQARLDLKGVVWSAPSLQIQVESSLHVP